MQTAVAILFAAWMSNKELHAVDKLGGPDNVAEMTGRKGRVIADKKGRGFYTLRANPDSHEMDSLNVHETGGI